MAAGPVAGTAYFRVNGGMLPLQGDVKIKAAPFERKSVTGVDGIDHGWTETPMAQGFELTLTTTRDVDLAAIHAIAGVTGSLECNNGWFYTLANMRQVGPVDADMMAGKLPLQFVDTMIGRRG